MQLKILLENKLKSKYCKQDVDFLAVEKFIQKQLEELFELPVFDEKDLVALDRRVQNYVKSLMAKKTLREDSIERPQLAASVTSARLKGAKEFALSPRLTDQ